MTSIIRVTAWCAIIIITCVMHSKLASTFKVESMLDAVDYLEQFGYLTGHSLTERMTDQINEGIAKFQKFSGLPETGEMNTETMSQMNKLRCGMVERMDIMENKAMNRGMVSHPILKRPRRWGKLKLYYKIHNSPASLYDHDIVRREVRRAFQMWEEVTNLECTEVEQTDPRNVDIGIAFYSGNHGDGVKNAFGNSSVGNVVAHAFYPDHEHFHGDIHFDNSRDWTASPVNQGINLFQVAAHEIGHALGLEHSVFKSSVMYMQVRAAYNESYKLHEDDIMGIQKLYGKRKIRQDYSKNNRIGKVLMFPDDKQASKARSHSYKIEFPSAAPGAPPKSALIDVSDQPVEKPLQNFWNCFTLSNRNGDSQVVSDCYKQNALSLLHYLKL